jgi:hypothetical protein
MAGPEDEDRSVTPDVRILQGANAGENVFPGSILVAQNGDVVRRQTPSLGEVLAHVVRVGDAAAQVLEGVPVCMLVLVDADDERTERRGA